MKACLNLIPFNELWLDKEIEGARNVYLSSGNATVADKTLSDMGAMISENIVRFLEGKEMLSEVRRDMLPRMT